MDPDFPDYLEEQYLVQSVIGRGAYGTVFAGTHLKTGRKIAIKCVSVVDQHPTIALRTLRELKLLRHFRENAVDENITTILHLPRPPSLDAFERLFIVMDYWESDLHRVIKTQELSDDHCQYFVYQILRGLKTIGSANIIHRDLKPSNLLVDSQCNLKICDFGLARSVSAKTSCNEYLTEYVATRWYRAPEIILSRNKYSKAIDMWSVGCILAEMIRGSPLFPGRDIVDQLDRIFIIMGTPSTEDQKAVATGGGLEYLRSMPVRRGIQLSQSLPDVNPWALQFLTECLEFNPAKRITVEQALAHPYMAPYHDPTDEPSCPPIATDLLDFENQEPPLTRQELKWLIYNEIATSENCS